MSAKIPKVSRIAPIPQISKRAKKIKKAKSGTLLGKVLNEKQMEEKHKILSQLLFARLYFIKKGSYKNYRQAKIKYAEYAAENYDAVKTLPKNKVPTMSMHHLSPLMPFYAIRTARILITDMFRKKTPAELKLAQLTKEEKVKLNYKG